MLEAGMVACWEDLVKDTKLFYVLEKNSSCNFIVIVIVTLLKVFPGEKTDSTDGDKGENDEKLRLKKQQQQKTSDMKLTLRRLKRLVLMIIWQRG